MESFFTWLLRTNSVFWKSPKVNICLQYISKKNSYYKHILHIFEKRFTLNAIHFQNKSQEAESWKLKHCKKFRKIFGRSQTKFFYTLYKKWSFRLRISSVNVAKSAKKLRIWSHLLKKSLMQNFIFLCSKISMVWHIKSNRGKLNFNQWIPEVYSGPCQTFKMELFVKINHELPSQKVLSFMFNKALNMPVSPLDKCSSIVALS